MTDFQIAKPGDFNPPETVQLPSQEGTDQAVLLKRPDLISLVAAGEGDIPDVLTGLIMQTIERQGQRTEFTPTRENLPQIMQAVNVLCKATFVQPKVWDADSDETHLSVQDIPFADKMFVFGWALGGEYKPAKSFRPEPNGSVDAVPSDNGLPSKAKRRAAAHA